MNRRNLSFVFFAALFSMAACGEQTTPLPVGNSVVQSPQPVEPQPDVFVSSDAGQGLGQDVAVEEGESCVDGDVSSFSSCCESGPARCVPAELVAPRLREFLGSCENGGVCVPELIGPLKDVYIPETCSSLGGLPGACMSACVPGVQGFVSFLNQDICTEGELCVPCVNPLDQTDTGVCQELECSWDYVPDTSPGPDPEPEPGLFDCDNPPPIALIDPESFPSCCEGAHCVPTSLVSEDLLEDVELCSDGVSACVPDDFIKFNGIFTPSSCTAPGGLEGRCLSQCLPSVIEQIDKLVQAECDESLLCVPCCDPITGEHTGACEAGCDTGPVDGICEATYEECCKGAGHCIPEELVPSEDLDSLRKKNCSKGYKCVPDLLQQENPVVPTCTGNILLQPDMSYTGVCLPKCLKIPLDILIWSGSCSKDDDCVPCTSPLDGTPTGAPGCP